MRAASCARAIHHDTPKVQVERGSTFCDFAIPGRKPWPLTLSHPQAKRWKSAKNQAASTPLAVRRRPRQASHDQHGRHGGATPQNRWNDAETAPSPHGRGTWRTAIRAWSTSAGSRRRTALAASRMAFPWTGLATAFAVSHEGFPSARGRPPPPPWPYLPEAWYPPESNKGLSERLSALEGKSTRVRRENPSKTPKNGFWRVF